MQKTFSQLVFFCLTLLCAVRRNACPQGNSCHRAIHAPQGAIHFTTGVTLPSSFSWAGMTSWRVSRTRASRRMRLGKSEISV